MAITLGEIKAIVNKETGLRFEGADLNNWMVEYATKNRETFILVFKGDVVEDSGGAPEAAPEVADGVPKYSRSQLMAKNKAALVEIAEGMGLVFEDDPTKETIVDRILMVQE